MLRLLLLLTCTTNVVIVHAEQKPITINGLFEDWDTVQVAFDDKAGDTDGPIDFRRLWITDDDRFLFLQIETSSEFDISDNNSIHLYLDTDANAKTGFSIAGIGAELRWKLGNRNGTFYHEGNTTTVYHNHIRFRSAPTITSKQFEIAIGRDTLPDGTNPLFTGSEVRVLLVDTADNDMMPEEGTILSYALDEGYVPPVTPISFQKHTPTNLRIVTNNILSDGLFTHSNQPSFQRLYTSVTPDILHLQEIYNHSATETVTLIESWLGENWYGAEQHDCKTISRYPIIGSWAIDNNLATLIDTTDSIGTQILCINAHLPCCSNDIDRQNEIDAIMAFIREAYLSGGELHVEPDVPVLIAGDLNLVGYAQQLDTLLTGDIQDESTHGPDAPPDPDGTNLTTITSRQTEKRMGYTWRKDYGSYWPGQLDFLIYSDSNLIQTHDFIVYTPEMSPEELLFNNLEEGDSIVTDHLLFCADFRRPCNADITSDGYVNISDLLEVIDSWGLCNQCPADVNGDAQVDVADLLEVVSAWGDCE